LIFMKIKSVQFVVKYQLLINWLTMN
jgi:hypothetical protein